MVYFISDGHGYVKIGVADDVNKRLKQLQTANPHPLMIVKTIKSYNCDDLDLEAWLHSEFQDYQCKTTNYVSEWFTEEGAVVDFIRLDEASTTLYIYEHYHKVSKVTLVNDSSPGAQAMEIAKLKKQNDGLKNRIEYLETLLIIKEGTK